MEADYRNSRREVASAIYGANLYLADELNKLWWQLSDISKRLSDLIRDSSEQFRAVERMAEELPLDELPLQDPGQ